MHARCAITVPILLQHVAMHGIVARHQEEGAVAISEVTRVIDTSRFLKRRRKEEIHRTDVNGDPNCAISEC